MPWTFPTDRPYFLDVIESWHEQHREACEIAKPRDWPELDAAEVEFTAFVDAIDSFFESDDPLLLLEPIPVSVALFHPAVKQLRSGSWRAYFAVSEEDKLIVGLVVLRADKASSLLRQMLDKAVS